MAEDEPEKVIADPNSEQNPDAKRTLQDDLTLGILQILQPAVEEIDSKVLNVRESQLQLRERIDQLTIDLQNLSVRQKPPVELDPYVKKLLNCRRRVVLVNSVLLNAQERLNKLQQNISREMAKKKAALDTPQFT